MEGGRSQHAFRAARVTAINLIVVVASAMTMTMTIAFVTACTDLGELSGGPTTATCGVGEQPEGDHCAPVADGGQSDGTAPGFSCPAEQQDNDGDHVCSPTCAAAKLTCVHAHCEDTTGKAACVCAAGYRREGDSCVWGGGLLDPGFQNQPAGSWQVAGGAVIDPTFAAKIDPGVARLAGAGTCTVAMNVKQTIQMPSIAEGEPFALEVSGTNDVDGDFYPQLRISSQWIQLLAFPSNKPTHTCLGERAYGKDIELMVTGDNEGGCSETSLVTIDHAAIVPASDCPIAGQIPNGDFEGTGTWIASGTAEVANGVGTAGGRGGHLSTTIKCASPLLSGKMSPPWKSMDRPALSFTYKGTTGQKMVVGVSNGDLGEARGTNTFQSAHFCLPEYTKGVVQSLRFYLPYRSAPQCTDPDVRDFVFDDITFVSDAKCPQVASIFNGDFETTGVVQPWVLTASEPYATPPIFSAFSPAVHSGALALQLSASQICGSSSATQMVTVPTPVGTAGPALKFWYRAPTQSQVTFSVPFGPALTASPTYTQRIHCIDPSYATRPFPLVIGAYPNVSGTCGTALATTEILNVDDIEITTDPTCPATK